MEDKIKGKILYPDHPEYAGACKVFNTQLKKRPAAIVYPEDTEDIQTALQWAKEARWKVSVRNGGHSSYGQCMQDKGMVLDMQLLNRVKVYPQEKRVVVQAGALLRDLDRATTPHQMAVPAGDCPMVGVTGLCLGGGNGFLSRVYGLTCDNLTRARLISPSGKLMTAAPEESPGLFRALRGAGHSNFGVVTELEFRLNPVPAKMPAGSIYWPLEQAQEVLRHYRDLMLRAPDQLNIHCRLNRERQAPLLRLYGIYFGPPEEGKAFFDELLSWGSPVFQDLRSRTYAEVQTINEQSITTYPSFEWESGIVRQPLSDAAIDDFVDCFRQCPNSFGRLNLDTLGGAINRMPIEQTAFVHRDAHYIGSIIGLWFDPREAEVCAEWTRTSYQTLQPHFDGGIYQNYANPETAEIERACYGKHLSELKILKNEMDPERLLAGSLS